MDINLIDGEFSQKDAKEILIQLINDKINFHVRKNFSSNIRFGFVDENSEKRVLALNQEIKDIITFFDQEDTVGKSYSIQAKIELREIEKDKVNTKN